MYLRLCRDGNLQRFDPRVARTAFAAFGYRNAWFLFKVRPLILFHILRPCYVNVIHGERASRP